MGMENTREEENKMRNETNTGKGKQAARGGRSVGRPRDGFRAGDCKTNTTLFFFSIFFEIFGLGIVKILIGTEILTFLCPPRIVGGIF